jgi:hypothetical protein
LIPDLLEVMIVGKRLPHPTVSHHDKRRAVRETEGFISVPLEHLPGFVFPLWSNTDNRDQATGTNVFPKFDRNVMPCPMQQQGICFIEHEIARHIASPCGQQGPVECSSRLLERIAFVLERHPATRIHEDLAHGFRAP